MTERSSELRSESWIKVFLSLLFPLALMLLIAILILLLINEKVQFTEFKDGIALLSSLLTGYIGTIIGYYFGLDRNDFTSKQNTQANNPNARAKVNPSPWDWE